MWTGQLSEGLDSCAVVGGHVGNLKFTDIDEHIFVQVRPVLFIFEVILFCQEH